jgi:hypothetical protein
MHRFLLLIFWITILSVNPDSIADCPEFLNGIQSGTTDSNQLTEISGIAASRKNPGLLWVHNDSGGEAKTFAIDAEGTFRGSLNISDASNYDWEDIAIGPGPEENEDYLYVGDIGDNSKSRPYVIVYRVQEPNVDSGQMIFEEIVSESESIKLTYPDGPRDAETLLLDPVTRDLYIISKSDSNSRIYVARYPQSTSEITEMEYKGQLPWSWATGGDISAGGNLVIVRGYLNASVWGRTAGTELWQALAGVECAAPLVIEPQGEAICFDANGCGYYTVSEGTYQPIYYFNRFGECPLEGDPNGDGNVDLPDIEILTDHLLDAICSTENFWCDKCDLNKSREVDFIDYAFMGEGWYKTE